MPRLSNCANGAESVVRPKSALILPPAASAKPWAISDAPAKTSQSSRGAGGVISMAWHSGMAIASRQVRTARRHHRWEHSGVPPRLITAARTPAAPKSAVRPIRLDAYRDPVANLRGHFF